jgi:hypothetical protein
MQGYRLDQEYKEWKGIFFRMPMQEKRDESEKAGICEYSCGFLQYAFKYF